MQELVEKSVLDFTVQSGYDVTKYYPDPTERRSKLIEQNVRMVGSELNELLQSVMSFEDAVSTIRDIVQNLRNTDTSEIKDLVNKGTFSKINSFVIETFSKMNVDFTEAFMSIHQNNMEKRWEDGKFHLREEDGKVLKPPNHKEPVLVIKKIDNNAKFRPFSAVGLHDIVEHIMHMLYYMVGDGEVFSKLFSTDIHDCKMKPEDVVKNQVDAFIDILYYNSNTMVKLGIIY